MYLQRRVLYCTSASKGNYNSNDVDSKLKLQKFRDAIVDISAPHNSFDYATKVVICQYNIRGLFGNVCSSNTLKIQEFCKPKKRRIREIKITMAKPTSAFFKAGPSLVPSPVTATTSLLALILLLMMPLTKVYLSTGCDLARTLSLGQI